ncbi:MAG: hypothetical protein ACOCWC_04130 [Bacteroidota bacterium]
MKNFIAILSLSLFTLFVFNSCGDPMQKDADKLADLVCEIQELTEQYHEADEAKAEEIMLKINELDAKGEALSLEILEKYSTTEDQEAFNDLYMSALEECQ